MAQTLQPTASLQATLSRFVHQKESKTCSALSETLFPTKRCAPNQHCFWACKSLLGFRTPKSVRKRTVHVCRALGKDNSGAFSRGGKNPIEEDPLFTEGLRCPVPSDQQPINEYKALSNSIFFSWVEKEPWELAGRLGVLGVGVFAFLGWPVASLSFDPSEEPLKVAVGALAGALLSVTVACVRLYMGWQYVGNRLASATVEYEESGWYDGQTWVKSPEVMARDRLLGTYRVRPILRRLKSVLTGLGVSLASCSLLLLSYSSNTHEDSEFQQIIRAFILVPALFIRLPGQVEDQESHEDLPKRRYLIAGAVAFATLAAVYLYGNPSGKELDRKDDGRIGLQPWSRHYSEFVAAPAGTYSDEDARQFEPPGTFDDVSKAGPADVSKMEGQGSAGLPDFCR